ncbi:MAG: glutamate 5-kinase [Saccharofermentanaceae bacterium]|jgi:glutamate 5-kinase|nr:glutamate 5-kinase [Clostridia bacterium]NLX68570.1 glutamate 5-kinase [Clostridiaceae bacterium]HOO49073.1 glutamate 5-kinase [Saccharofermentans sp.]HPG64153.1 glutamate 5-kinase [Saccharofermentans sp.]HPJ81647.1 glutamate 5-kinase [Saccharofermentans sp.]
METYYGGSRVALNFAKRIVVKVGTSTITYENGRINLGNIDRLCRALADLQNSGKEVLLVTSGAIGVGVGVLNLEERPTTMRDKQAIAAVGQCELMNAYSRSFAEYSYVCGQILLTKDGLTDKLTRVNVTNTIEALIEKRIIPVINENDSVSTAEILHNGTFGDNDTLSAHVACLINADLLIILSDIDGLYDDDPKLNDKAKRISYVEQVTDEMEEIAKGAGSKLGTGGMHTKISAMQMVMAKGINGVIAEGSSPQVLERILDQEDVGTFFAATN